MTNQHRYSYHHNLLTTAEIPNPTQPTSEHRTPITSSAVTYLHPRIGPLKGRAGQGSSNGARTTTFASAAQCKWRRRASVPRRQHTESLSFSRLVLSGCNCSISSLLLARSVLCCIPRRKRGFGPLDLWNGCVSFSESLGLTPVASRDCSITTTTTATATTVSRHATSASFQLNSPTRDL
jgi:hypothetical protein